MIYVLDACALIAYVRGESGKSVVEDILLDPRLQVIIHAINMCEVYYDFVRAEGQKIADDVVEDSIAAGIEIREDLDLALWKAAGDLKAKLKRISLADAFALAFARRMGATLVTSDYKEFDNLTDLNICQILFIR